MGFVAVGSSIGGTVLPITAQKLIPLVGCDYPKPVVFWMLFILTQVSMDNANNRVRSTP